jgi:hypothetical protein
MGFSHFSGLGLFCFKTGLQHSVERTVEAVKGIDALHRLDYTGPAPHALIVGDPINDRVSCFFRRSLFHDKPPCLWIIGFF